MARFIKKLILTTIFTFIVLNFLSLKSPSFVLACIEKSCKIPNTYNYYCGAGCEDCPGCQYDSGGPVETVDENKINNPLLPARLSNLSGISFLEKFLVLGIRLGFFIGAVIFFFMLIIGAIRWITSGGDKAGLEGAKNQITHALIGLVILLSFFAIINLVGTIFGISFINLTLPTL